MKINELFKIQASLETQAIGISKVNEDELNKDDALNIRMIALQVKLGELANLTKCYKYTKTVEELPRGKVLFRYLEGMKYLLSLGNKYQMNMINDDAIIKDGDDSITTLITKLYEGITDLKRAIENDRYIESLSCYIHVFSKYIQLAKALQISYDEAYAYFSQMTISA